MTGEKIAVCDTFNKDVGNGVLYMAHRVVLSHSLHIVYAVLLGNVYIHCNVGE